VALLSMTGFGEACEQRDGYAFAIELRTVNSRYFKLNLRTSDGFGALEAHVESAIRDYIKRGTVYCNIRIRHLASAEDFRLNKRVLGQYLDQLQELAAERDLDEELRLEPLASLPGVVEELSTESLDASKVWPLLQPTLHTTLERLGKMRAVEGEALAVDLQQQCQTVAKCLDTVEERAPCVAQTYQQRIQDRVNEALEGLQMKVEPADLVREVAMFADRADISEEIVRLRSHLQQFAQAMKVRVESWNSSVRRCPGKQIPLVPRPMMH